MQAKPVSRRAKYSGSYPTHLPETYDSQLQKGYAIGMTENIYILHVKKKNDRIRHATTKKIA